jgi:hypothetical protein
MASSPLREIVRGRELTPGTANLSVWLRAERLERTIHDIVQRWLARPLLLACASYTLGCGGSDEPSRLPAAGSGFDPVDCSIDGWDPMPNVKPSQRFDYTALRRTHGFDAFAGQPATTTMSTTGRPCLHVTDETACATALDKLPSGLEMNQCGMADCDAYLLSTSLGDEVQQWATREDWLRFLGKIDAPEDALLMAFYDRYDLGHDDDDVCNTAAVRKVQGGYQVYATRVTSTCAPTVVTRYLLQIEANGKLTRLHTEVARTDGLCAGRRPEGLCTEPARAASTLGAFFAHSTQLEAASVRAFDAIAAELRAHDAPRDLIAEAESARADEVRHARRVGELAHRFGATVGRVRVAAAPPRSLLAMALDNAREGCVRETWGALVGSLQALRAHDACIAATYASIAQDERRHAAFSWRLAAWLAGKLDASGREQVVSTYCDAIAELRAHAARPQPLALSWQAGLPDPASSHVLLGELERTVWAAAPA